MKRETLYFDALFKKHEFVARKFFKKSLYAENFLGIDAKEQLHLRNSVAVNFKPSVELGNSSDQIHTENACRQVKKQSNSIYEKLFLPPPADC